MAKKRTSPAARAAIKKGHFVCRLCDNTESNPPRSVESQRCKICSIRWTIRPTDQKEIDNSPLPLFESKNFGNLVGS